MKGAIVGIFILGLGVVFSLFFVFYKQGYFRPLPYDVQNVSRTLFEEMGDKGLSLGNFVFIRIFKKSAELEVWVRRASGRYALFKVYDICKYSGDLGPKLREGDGQSPEGFYEISRSQLHPNSSYHLAFNLGFPNAYDRAHGRTGSFLMVHGNCVSIGCYAMTDKGIEEIYTLVESALSGGQGTVPVHIFPFRMTEDMMLNHGQSKWSPYWVNLKEGYDFFESHGGLPQVSVADKKYVFR